VCYNAPADTAYVHRNAIHLCVCRACAAQTGQKCVVCNMPAIAVAPIYNACRAPCRQLAQFATLFVAISFGLALGCMLSGAA
jgi:hypothetical protein